MEVWVRITRSNAIREESGMQLDSMVGEMVNGGMLGSKPHYLGPGPIENKGPHAFYSTDTHSVHNIRSCVIGCSKV
jgi:hypothetical protein